MRRVCFVVAILLMSLIGSLRVAAQTPVKGSVCQFDSAQLKFKGDTDLAQAKCLLRTVGKDAELGELLITLPEPLERLIGQPVATNQEELRRFREKAGTYLSAKGLSAGDVGGPLANRLARANDDDKNYPFVRYFVIHDTSSPNLCEDPQFPSDINEKTWIWGNWLIPRTRWNNVSRSKNNKEAHVFVTRNGDSTNAQNRTFATPWRATKLEKIVGVRSKGLFIHIENLQPRRFEARGNEPPSTGGPRDPHYYKLVKGEWECRNDRIGPAPGLSDAQLDRLALLYVAASVRRGVWLIPAFHATVDAGLSGGHDDPQHFDLNRWAQRLASLLEVLSH